VRLTTGASARASNSRFDRTNEKEVFFVPRQLIRSIYLSNCRGMIFE
jgi:hypothetical protein